MDADRFDALSRFLVSRRSRRRLAAAAGLALGGLLVRAPFDSAHDALAKKKKKKKKKNPSECPASMRCGRVCCTPDNPVCCPNPVVPGGKACIARYEECGYQDCRYPCGTVPEVCCNSDQRCCPGPNDSTICVLGLRELCPGAALDETLTGNITRH